MLGRKEVNDVLSSFARVGLSNLVRVISGILVTIALPLLLTKEDFGYYRIFVLYMAYIGVFGVGLVDGVYIKLGGQTVDAVDRVVLSSYTRLIVCLQLLFALVLFGLTLFLHGEVRALVALLAGSVFIINVSGYLQLIGQALGEFKVTSSRTIIYSILNVVVLVGLYAYVWLTGNEISYEVYVLGFLGINSVCLVWYVISFRSLILNRDAGIRLVGSDAAGLIAVGLPLLIVSLLSVFFNTLDSLVVSHLSDKATFAVYSFPYTVVNVYNLAVTSLSTVLFPTFRRLSRTVLLSSYRKYLAYFQCCAVAVLPAFYLLALIVENMVPKFINSVPILNIVLLTAVVNSIIAIIYRNIFATFELTRQFMVLYICGAAVEACGLWFVVVYRFELVYCAAMVLLANLFLYALCEFYASKISNTKFSWDIFYIIATFIVFEIIYFSFDKVVAFVLSIAAILLISGVYLRFVKRRA